MANTDDTSSLSTLLRHPIPDDPQRLAAILVALGWLACTPEACWRSGSFAHGHVTNQAGTVLIEDVTATDVLRRSVLGVAANGELRLTSDEPENWLWWQLTRNGDAWTLHASADGIEHRQIKQDRRRFKTLCDNHERGLATEPERAEMDALGLCLAGLDACTPSDLNDLHAALLDRIDRAASAIDAATLRRLIHG